MVQVHGPAQGSESYAFVYTVVSNQAHGLSNIQCSCITGRESLSPCAVKVILLKQEVAIGISMYMDAVRNKDRINHTSRLEYNYLFQ